MGDIVADLRAPFPWFGGKSKVSDIVWDRFGSVPNYVEPFNAARENAVRERIWFSPHCLKPQGNLFYAI